MNKLEPTELTVPVAFIIFNRPDLTEQVFVQISRARPRKLLVVADGPRTEAEKELCARTRAVVDRVDWPCEVIKNYSEVNLGCKVRVSSGIDWVFSQVEEAIILEDDCVPDLSFFPYCAEMLERYREDKRIMMVAGLNYFGDQWQCESDYFFSRYVSIWGWATWRRAWAKYDVTMAKWPEVRAGRKLDSLYSEKYMRAHMKWMFDITHANNLDTWDLQWAFAFLLGGGLSVVPGMNLISNIGPVGTHTHSADQNHFMPLFSLPAELRHPSDIVPDLRYDQSIYERNFKNIYTPTWLSRLKDRLRSIPLLLKLWRVVRPLPGVPNRS